MGDLSRIANRKRNDLVRGSDATEPRRASGLVACRKRSRGQAGMKLSGSDH